MPSHPTIAQLPPTAGISDPQTRQFLDALASMLNVRNGNVSAAESQRFVTLEEVSSLTKSTIAGIFNSRGGPGLPPDGIDAGPNAILIDGLAGAIMQSELFRRLGERIDRITAPWDSIENVNRIVAGLLGDVDIAKNDVTRLTIVTNTAVTDILALNTTVGSHTTQIVSLLQTTADTATSLLQLTARMSNAEGSITDLRQVTLDPNYITATSYYGLLASMGNVVRTFWQDDPPSGISLHPGDQWFDTGTNPPKHYYWEGAWIEGWMPLSQFSFAGITNERNARVTRDTASATAINNIWAMLGGTAANIQEGSFVDTNHFTTGASKWDTVYAAVVSPSGANLVAAVRTDLEAEINRVTGITTAYYGIRVEAGPEGSTVVGGMGLMATYDGSATIIDFTVRADRFALCSAATQGGVQTIEFPFMALSTPQIVDGVRLQPGVYITNAVIADASIDIAKIKSHIESDNFDGGFVTVGDFDYINQSDLGTAGWAIDRSGFAVFSNAVIRDTCRVGRLSVDGAVEGSINIENNSTGTVTHNENRKVMVTLWTPNGSAVLTHLDDNSFTIRLDFSAGSTVYYRYW